MYAWLNLKQSNLLNKISHNFYWQTSYLMGERASYLEILV